MSDETKPEKKKTYFSVRDSLGSIKAVREYDNYLKEHKKRLTQLYRELHGEMSPSEDSYDD